MKPTLSTLSLFFKQSGITFGAIILLVIVLTAMTFFVVADANKSAGELLKFSLFTNSVISSFIGLYIGGGYFRLRQSYLWYINDFYRHNLIFSFVCAAIIISLLQSIVLIYSGWNAFFAFLAPASIIILTAQLLVAKNFLTKLILTPSPFLLFLLTQYQISYFEILSLLICLAIFGVVSMTSDKSSIIQLPPLLANSNKDLKMQLKNPITNKLNNWCGDFFQKIINISSNGKVFVALIHPSTRFGAPLVFILIFLFIIASINPKGSLQLTTVSAMYMAFIPVIFLIEIQALSKQTKSFAHVFSFNRHQKFKTEIAKNMDHQTIKQTALFTLLVIAFGSLIQANFDSILMLRLALTINLTFLAFLPLMLCLDWFNIGFKLLFAMASYLLFLFFLCRWHFHHQLEELVSIEVLGVIAIFIAIRFLSLHLWKKQSVEIFMRTFG